MMIILNDIRFDYSIDISDNFPYKKVRVNSFA